MKEDNTYDNNLIIACPFVRNGECEIPPCNSCFLYNCISNPEWESDENERRKHKK